MPVRPSPSSFAFDPDEAVTRLRESDDGLARLMDAVGPFAMQLRPAPSIFAALSEAIVYQQLSGKAAATIHGRLLALFPAGPRGYTPERLLALEDETLRGAGLSRPKVLALRDLARRAAGGELPTLGRARAATDEELVAKLTEVRGIGRWSVEMLLMFRLGRPDVLPVDDLGIQKGFAIAFRKRGLPDRAAIARRGARWAPYRTVASWYLWRANELPSGWRDPT